MMRVVTAVTTLMIGWLMMRVVVTVINDRMVNDARRCCLLSQIRD